MRKLLTFFILTLLATTATRAAIVTGTIEFGSASGRVNINSASVTGDDNLGNSWTITTAGTTSFTPNAAYAQVGSSNKPATSITFTTTLPSSVTITSLSAKFGGFSGTAGTVTLKVGNTTVGTGSLNQSTDVYVNSSATATGTVLTVTVTGISKGVRCYDINYSYEDGSSVVNEPTFSLTDGTTYREAKTLTMSCATTGATIYYTTDGTIPSSSSTPYTTTLSYDSNGTYTVKAIAIKNGVSSEVASITFTINLFEGEDFELVTDAGTLSAGDEIIFMSAASGEGRAMSTTQNSNNRGATKELTITNNKVTSTVDTQVLTLEGSSAGWYFNTSDGYLYAASSTNNYLRTQATQDDNAKATITIRDSKATIIFQGENERNELRYNNGTQIYSCYASTSTQPNAYIFKKVTSGTEQVATPTFSPAAGTYNEAQNVTITCATGGATIYYTTNGSDPTTSSSVYSGPIAVSATTTIKAMAVKTGMTDSEVATATYTIESASSSTCTATFIFNTTAGLQALGITPTGQEFNLENNSYVTEDVTLTSTDGSTATRVWNVGNNVYDLRIYKNGGSLTLTVPSNCSITSIVFAGSDLYLALADGCSGGYNTNGTWTGEASSVTFNATATTKINTITVTYSKTTPDVEYPEVVGIAAFKQVEAGTTVKLKLTDESNARVLHVENGTDGAVDAYVRDNTGAIVLKGIKPNCTMAYNQHLAGWIVGQHEVEATTGLPQLIPVADTNTDELVIAEPVTEAVTLPVEIEMSDMDEKLADWATVRNVRMGGNGVPEITDAFGASGYTAPYQGALVDVTGIVTNGKIYPMTEDAGYPLVTYVLDATQEFTSPATTVADVPLRWQRRFVAGQWTPVTVPFAIDEFDGTVMRYTSLSDGGTTTTAGGSYATGQMNFSEVTSIEPGVPYLVKPRDGYNSMSFDNVTITTTAPATLSYTTRGAVSGGSGSPARSIAVDDTYSMVGTYSPMTVEEDNSNKLIVGGDVVWAGNGNGNTVEGSSAYLNTPKNQAIKLNMGDGVIITGIDTIEATETPARTGIYNLLGMKLPGDWESLPPGIYIVNGKKMVKQ